MGGKIVIAGASGLVGSAAVKHFQSLDNWDVIGLSRRATVQSDPRTHFISVDLSDAADCRTKLGGISGATRLLYCALSVKPDPSMGWLEPDHMSTNLGMLVNFLDALLPANDGLRHVSLLQGAKAYGVHLGPAKIPSREVDPRHIHSNFYWLQEDHLKKRQEGQPWRWTIFRPQFIVGFALGSPMNMLSAIGVYGSISRELGLPLVFPGFGGPAVVEFTDVRILAQAIEWSGCEPAAHNQTFNITNGDAIVWEHIWPDLARHFRIEVGARHPMSLAAVMPGKESVWTEIQHKYGLERHPYDQLVGQSWQFADLCFGLDANAPSSLISTIKIRKAGFPNCIDSIEMLNEWLGELERGRIIPDPRSS